MPGTYTHKFDTPAYKGEATIHTGLFIGGKWVDPIEGGTIEVVNPATGKVVTTVSAGTKADVDLAVQAAEKAYKTVWGLHYPGAGRGKLLNKLADLIEKNIDEFAALEALDVGKVFAKAKAIDIGGAITCLRYYAGWADKVQGKTIETTENKLAYTRHEPYGVVGQIVPWNFPMGMVSWKIGPALATGNTVVLKPSEITPLTALKLADLINEAGFPPGVVNIVNGYGHTVGQAISEHPGIHKVAFTLTGRKILKVVTLELGPLVVDQSTKIDLFFLASKNTALATIISALGVWRKNFHSIYPPISICTDIVSPRPKARGDAVGSRAPPDTKSQGIEALTMHRESGEPQGGGPLARFCAESMLGGKDCVREVLRRRDKSTHGACVTLE